MAQGVKTVYTQGWWHSVPGSHDRESIHESCSLIATHVLLHVGAHTYTHGVTDRQTHTQ